MFISKIIILEDKLRQNCLRDSSSSQPFSATYKMTCGSRRRKFLDQSSQSSSFRASMKQSIGLTVLYTVWQLQCSRMTYLKLYMLQMHLSRVKFGLMTLWRLHHARLLEGTSRVESDENWGGRDCWVTWRWKLSLLNCKRLLSSCERNIQNFYELWTVAYWYMSWITVFIEINLKKLFDYSVVIQLFLFRPHIVGGRK